MAKKKPKDALRFRQVEAGKQALEPFNPALQWFIQNAGLQMPQAPPSPGMPQAPPGMPPLPQQPGMTQQRSPVFGGRGGFGMQQATPSPQMQLAQMQAQGQPRASVQPVGGQSPMMPQQPQVGLPSSALGIYGQNPADVYRLQQAEEDVDRMAGQRANMLQYRLGQQGIGGSGTMASALAQNERSAMDQLAGFRRNLAIGAGTEQERRMQQILAMMGMGQGIGSQGQAISGQYKQLEAQKPGLLQQLAPFASMFAPIKI